MLKADNKLHTITSTAVTFTINEIIATITPPEFAVEPPPFTVNYTYYIDDPDPEERDPEPSEIVVVTPPER